MNIWLVKIGEGARGGRPFRIDMLAAALGNRGHHVRLYTSTFSHYEKVHLYDGDTESTVDENFTVVFMRSPGYQRNISIGRLWDHRCIARRFAQLARADLDRPDLIFCCLPTLDLAAESVRLGHEWGIPVVIDVRDPWPDVYFRVFPRWAQGPARLLLRPWVAGAESTLSRATGITAVSEQYLAWALQYAGRQKRGSDGVFGLSYTPPQFSAEDRHQAARKLEAAGVDFSSRLCIFPATLGSSYDIEGVLKCAAALAREPRFADVRIVFAGDGDKRSLLEAPGLPANVLYVGWLGRAEVACLMENAALGLLCSNRQAQLSVPNKVYEYMANGVPMICSIEGEARSIIERHECGIRYPVENVEEMTAAIATLLDDPERRRRAGQNGRRIYNTFYRPEVVYGQLSQHLETLAQSEKRPVSKTSEPRPDRCVTEPEQPVAQLQH
jgi:glycosyltransferase involved in cell wall biosynthesis